MWAGYILQACLITLALGVAAWVIKMHNNPNTEFNAMRLLMSKGSDGVWRESRRAIGELVAISVSTWGFIFLVSVGKLTEWYMASWMAILLGWSVLKKQAEKPNAS